MAFGTDFSGFKKRIDTMIEMAGHRAIDMVNELTGIGEAQAKAYVQVDSGELRESIHIAPAEIKGGEVEGSWGTSNDHAIFNEYGTGQRGMSGETGTGLEKDPNTEVAYRLDWPGMKAYPFMYPSTKLVEEVMPDIIEKHAKKFTEG